MNRIDAIRSMNRLGSKRIPFLFIIDFDMLKSHVLPIGDIDRREILYDINGFSNHTTGTKLLKKITFSKRPLSLNRYRSAFKKVISNLEMGNTYLLNLTFPTSISTNLTLKEIFENSRAKYKLYFKNKFVVFSPERFISIDGKTISSNPMKGTIDASIRNAKEVILSDKKELAEHYTIVDLIRNDLSMVANSVRVERFRYVEKIKTQNKNLLQVSSKITGTLPKNYRTKIGDIIFKLLPAGSVTGAPKNKTVKIIKEVENYTRGYYTGIFGYFDGFKLDSGVMIRFIERSKGKMVYKSGGGITALSEVKNEYQELIDKIYVPVV
jgi:para-aminobenzoate synthetase component 1